MRHKLQRKGADPRILGRCWDGVLDPLQAWRRRPQQARRAPRRPRSRRRSSTWRRASRGYIVDGRGLRGAGRGWQGRERRLARGGGARERHDGGRRRRLLIAEGLGFRGDASRAGQGHRGVRQGEWGEEEGEPGAAAVSDGDDLTHIDGRCRLAEGRTRGGSLPLTALIVVKICKST